MNHQTKNSRLLNNWSRLTPEELLENRIAHHNDVLVNMELTLLRKPNQIGTANTTSDNKTTKENN